MTHKKNLLIALLIITSICLGIFYYTKRSDPKDSIAIFSEGSIPAEKETNISFYCDGFILSTKDTTEFYDFEGNEVQAPILEEDMQSISAEPLLTHSTSSYILFNERYLFDVTSNPFKLAYVFEYDNVWDIKELDNKGLLVLLLNNNTGLAEPFFAKEGFEAFDKFDGLGDSVYLDADYHSPTSGLSILTVTYNSPLPASKVFQYSKTNNPFGVISSDDQFLVKVYRLSSHVVLVGTREILCYNTDCTQAWKIQNLSSCQHQKVSTTSGMILYFDDASLSDKKENSLIIDKDGRYALIQLPKSISSMQSYKNGIAGIEKKRYVIVIDNKGRILKRYIPDCKISSLYWTSYNPDLLYIFSEDNQLHFYSSNK